jgi:hypothetical protein
MSCNLYALLVGIDRYSAPVTPLRGCVNDVKAVQDYLEGRVTSEAVHLHLQVLLDEQATRQAVIDGFRNHLCKAGSNDVVLFYYSGHGSQELAPPEFWAIEPDHLNETIVCWDSRTPGGWDLADKELSKLIAEVDSQKPHISIIMDCCHSGSGTRDHQETDTRWAPLDNRLRPLDSFIFSTNYLLSLTASRDLEQNAAGWSIPVGRHILLAACRDQETAKEFRVNGQSRGAFCYSLLDTLTQANGTLTYRDLYKRASTLVRNRVSTQTPQIEATHLKDLEQPFLGGAIAPHHPYFTASYHQQHGWVIDGGAIHGLLQPSQGETTVLALFPFNQAQKIQNSNQALIKAEITHVLPQLSMLKITEGEDHLSEEIASYKAMITSVPLPRLGVYLEGDTVGIKLVRQAIQQVEGEQRASLYVREVDCSEEIGLRVLAHNHEYLITSSMDEQPLSKPIQTYTPQSAALIVQRLEHMARWLTIAELTSPPNSRIPSEAVQLQLFRGDQPIQSAEEILDTQVRLTYDYNNTTHKWQQPTFRVKLKNTSHMTLYCALLDLSEQYAISAELLSTGGVWLNPHGEIGDEVWALAGQPCYASVPKELHQQGITEFRDTLQLIVCTTEFDATLLQQEKIDRLTPFGSRSTKRDSGTLNRLMKRVVRRDLNRQSEDDENCDDWMMNQVTITTVRSLNHRPVSNLSLT